MRRREALMKLADWRAAPESCEAARRTAPLPISTGRDGAAGRTINLLLRLVPLLAMRLEGSRSLGSRRLHRRNRDLLALKSAFQCRDAGGDITFPAVFQRQSGVERPGITVRVVPVI